MCTSKSSVAVACFLPGRAKNLSTPLYWSIVTEYDYLRNLCCVFVMTFKGHA